MFLLLINQNIDGSGTGTTTLNNGLEFGNFPFGTRVEDEKISLNKPDVIEVLVFTNLEILLLHLHLKQFFLLLVDLLETQQI